MERSREDSGRDSLPRIISARISEDSEADIVYVLVLLTLKSNTSHFTFNFMYMLLFARTYM